MEPNELKAQALLERVSEITAAYENRIADLRVEVTILSLKLQEYQNAEEPENVETEEAPADEADQGDEVS